MLLPEPLISHNGPSTLLVTLNEQVKENRMILHLLHYIPERRSQDIDIIEDVIPLYNLKVSLRLPKSVKSISCVPQNENLKFDVVNNRIEFTVPSVNGHQMVELQFK